MYARERERQADKSLEYLHQAGIHHAFLLLGMPFLGVGVLLGALLARMQFVSLTFPFLDRGASNILLVLVVGGVTVSFLQLAVRRIVKNAAYAPHHAAEFSTARDRWIAEVIYWAAFGLSLGIPVAIIVLLGTND